MATKALIRLITRFCAASGCALLATHPISAHDLSRSPNTHQWSPKRLSFMPTDTPRSTTGLPPALEWVVVLPNRWAIGQELHVCFIGGDDAVRQRIMNVATTWSSYANLRIVTGGPAGQSCTPTDKSEIRISFNEPGYWSYIGTEALDDQLVSQGLSSMNLEGFDTAPPPEPRFTGIVLHEFGHALAFHHEHQSPASGCDAEYDWPKLYAYYQAHYDWNKDKVDQNIRQLQADHSAFDWSNTDKKSIMIYGSDPKFLRRGTKSKCYFHDNNALSTLDIEGASKTYSQQAVTLSLKSRASGLQHALESTVGGTTRRALSKQLEITNGELQKAK